MIPTEKILEPLSAVIDPEVGLNIVEMGLVYRAEEKESGIFVEMTMTSPACPMGGYIQKQAEAALRSAFPKASQVNVSLVWDPPWGPDKMTDDAKKKLGIKK
ncbi:MAG: metal-sulfur cluster assembly factor [Nitrospinae bacterium]|nr:metal-sulfur cluster assembly factor [Nitrospinota bacterium]